MSRLEHETTTIFPSVLSIFIYYSLLKLLQTSAFSPVADQDKLMKLRNKTIKINKKRKTTKELKKN